MQVPKWVCVLAIFLGSAALIIQAAVDIHQGVDASMDWQTWLTQAWQMALPTGFTLVFAAFGGVLLNAHRWFVAGAIYALVFCYMAYTASNSMDFVSNATVGRTQAQIAKQTMAKDIVAIQNDTLIRERQDRSENLWRTYVTARTDKDKAAVLAQIKEASQEPLALQQPEFTVVPVGVGGTVNRYLSWRPEAIQEVKAIALPILVMIGKALGITLGFAYWPHRAAERWRERPPTAPLSDDSFRETKRKLSRDEAREDVLRMISTGARVGSGKEMANRWGVREGTASKWLTAFRHEGLIRREANGNARAIVGVPHLNGRLLHSGGAA